MSNNIQDSARTNRPGQAPITIHQPYRWTFGGVVAQLLLLSVVSVGAFGGGYYFRESQGLASQVDVISERLDALEQVAALEQQILELKLADAKRDAQRGTVMEVDLQAILTPLRQSVLDAADALATRLAVDVEEASQSAIAADVFGPAVLLNDGQIDADSLLLLAEERISSPAKVSPEIAAEPTADVAAVPAETLPLETETLQEIGELDESIDEDQQPF